VFSLFVALEYALSLFVMLCGHVVAAQAHDNEWLTDGRTQLQREMRAGFVPRFAIVPPPRTTNQGGFPCEQD
jgi:hypothetical protein